MEQGHFEKTPDGRCFCITDDVTKARGTFPLLSDDCRKIFRRGKTFITDFRCGDTNTYCRVCKENGLKIIRDDLIVTCQEKIRFEKTLNVHGAPEIKELKIIDDIPTIFHHENNYHHVKLDNIDFSFGMIQANVIKILHAASKTEYPWVHCKILLNEAGSTSSRIRDLFKAKKGWQKLIVSDKKGNYRLNL
ncbi:MAG: hypothetical protein GY804_01860 [Alphaproteobacteria bacterium]|nr:hypothetical protein [Alphaproteobacteria bacterium]